MILNIKVIQGTEVRTSVMQSAIPIKIHNAFGPCNIKYTDCSDRQICLSLETKRKFNKL